MEQDSRTEEDGSSGQNTWPTPPTYVFPPTGPSREGPKLLGETRAQQETSGIHAEGDKDERLFWRSAKWSPDGSHLLCQAEDHSLDLFRLDVGDQGAWRLRHSLSIPLPTPILDAAWYPLARCDDSQGWCFAVSARDVPIRLVDAYSGVTRATYIIIDHTERFVGPHALSFSPDGMCLYAAHVHTLSIFNVSLPGGPTQQLQIIPSRRAPRGTNPGQRGLLSSLAVCSASDEGEGVVADIVALGTFAGTVGLYRIPHSTASLKVESCLISGWREPENAAVTQLAFHPTAPWLLFVGTRGRQSITTYDSRYLGHEQNFRRPPPAPSRVGVFERCEKLEVREDEGKGRTQQKLRFDIDWGGRWMVAGDSEGRIRAWDVRVDGASYEADADEAVAARGSSSSTSFGNAEAGVQASFGAWTAGKDGVGAVALHPLLPLCATTTGSRHWEEGDSSDSSGEDGDVVRPRPRDAALRLWDLSGSD